MSDYSVSAQFFARHRQRVRSLAYALSSLMVLGSCTDGPLRERDQGPLLRSQQVYEDGQNWEGKPLPNLQNGETIPIARLREITSSEPRFGGWSAIRLTADHDLIAISDRGYWWKAPLQSLGAEQVDSAATPSSPLQMAALRDTDGNPLEDSVRRDSEGLIVLPNGGLVVSFERDHRLWYYPPARADQRSPVQNAAIAITTPPGLTESPYNGGAESLTRLPDGRLLVIAEGDDNATQTTGWIGTPNGDWGETAPSITWQTFQLSLDGLHNPTDATVVTGNRGAVTVVLTMRSFRITTGFSCLIATLPLVAIEQGLSDPTAFSQPVPEPVPVVRLSQPPLNDNWEAVESDGTTLWVMTDNNYNGLQRTLLLGLPLRALLSHVPQS